MSRHRRHSSLLLSIIPATIVVASLLAPGAAVAAPVSPSAPPTAHSTAGEKHEKPTTTLAKAAKEKLAADKAMREAREGDTSYTDGNYIVTLRGNPAATYTGGVKSFARTQPKAGDQLNTRSKKVVDYSRHLSSTQEAVAADAGATISQQYTIATNGFSSTLTATQAKALALDPRVETVTKAQLLHVQAETIDSGVHFLGLDGASGVWSTLGGFENAGKGIVIGELDTGIAPENASFAGKPLAETSTDGEPTKDKNGVISFTKANGKTFTSICQAGDSPDDQFSGAECNSKIIGAHYFWKGFGERAAIGTPAIGEYLSPRDGQGHGSHTASTAAGNHGVAATVGGKPMGDISGVAPAAKISVYKVCWSGVDPTRDSDDGCGEADSLAAIDQAIKDGVDVINFSIGGGAATTTISATGAAYLNAAVAGVFVAAAAGNNGPKPSTLDNAAPWITTVAASTIHSPEATATLGDGTKLLGVSISLPDGGLSGSLVAASNSGVSGASSPEFCGDKTLDPAKVAGKIVFCERAGNVDRPTKSKEVKSAGGIGMLLVNPEAGSLDPDLHSVPTIHLDVDSMTTVRSYAISAGATVTFTEGNPSDLPRVPTPQIAGFSSRGPVAADGGDLIKPDLTAPGVGILAATNNAQGKTGTYAFESGTSMATPHVAGLAALYLGVHPGATPAEVKSALMTTSHDLVDTHGDSSEDVFAQGAGEVDPTKFLDPGLIYLNGEDDWYRYAASLGKASPVGEELDASDLNLASIGIGALPGTQTVTRTVTSTKAGTFTADAVDIPGITTVISPTTMSFAKAGETQTFQVTFTRTTAEIGVYATGYLRWRDGATTVTSALAVRPSEFGVPDDVAGTGTDGDVSIPVTEGVTGQVDVSTTGLTKGTVVHGTGIADGAKDPQIYTFAVPADSRFLRFDLKADRTDVDLDLSIAWLGALGNTPVERGQADTDSAGERLDVGSPSPGRWIARVYSYAGTGPIDYTLSVFAMTDDNGVGAFTAEPATLDMVQATTGQEKVSWTGLDAGSSYLGLVKFGSDGARTAVTVTTPGAAPAPAPVPAAIEISPHYVRPGQPEVAMVAPGLEPDSDYSLMIDSSSDLIVSGKADSNGVADRMVTMPTSLSLGEHTATLHYAGGGTATTTFIVSDLTLLALMPDPDQNFTGIPAIPLALNYNGNGTVGFSMTSVDGKTSYLNERPRDVTTDPDVDWFPASTRTVDVGHPVPGLVKASAWVIEPGGAVGQTITITFTVDKTSSGAAGFVQPADDPSTVDFTMTQTSGQSLLATFVYKLCAGPMNFTEFDGKPGKDGQPGVSSIRLDMTGVVSVKAVLAGNTLASYTNRDASRCADGAPKMIQPLWVQASNDSADPAKPVHLTITNAVEARTDQLRIMAGRGTSVFNQPRILDETVAVQNKPRPPFPEPVVRTLDVAADDPVWARTDFDQELLESTEHPEGGIAFRTRRTLISAVNPAMLAAIDPNAPIPADPTDPSAPGDPGTGSGSTPAAGGPKTGLAATGVAIGLPIVAGAVFALLLGSVLVIRRRRTVAELIVDAKIDESD